MKTAILKDRINLDILLIRQIYPDAWGIVKNETTGEVEVYYDENTITGEELRQKAKLKKEKLGREIV